MKNYSILAILWILSFIPTRSQMLFNGNFQYGNEWIVKGQRYFKFYIPVDGIYSLTKAELETAGIPVGDIQTSQFQIFKNGQEISLLTSTESPLGSSDYILFYATHNRAELDASLFKSNTPLFNKEYSMFTDTAAYYLTWSAVNKGKRIEFKNNDNSNPLIKEDAYVRKETYTFNEFPTKRAHGTKRSLKLPDFDEGQGYGTGYFQERIFNLDFKHIFQSGEDALIQARVFSEGSGDGTIHKVNFAIDNNLYQTIQFTGYKVRESLVKLAADQLNSRMILKVYANAQPEDKVSISTIDVKYDSEFKFDQQTSAILYIKPSLSRKTIVIEDFNGGDEMILFDITNNFYLLSSKQSDGTYPINLPPSDVERQLFIVNKNQFITSLQISEVKMEDYASGNYNYLILSSYKLGNGQKDAIDDYVKYRSSIEGGNYKVKLVFIEDIEEQFGFGVKRHSIALRNFFQYSQSLWPDMKYVLIIGKGLEYEIYRTDPQYNEWNLVPTYSEPASDYLLVCDSLRNPLYSIGRLPVLSLQELTDYLNKVKEHESYLANTTYSIENREWLKRVVHLAGGDPTLYATLRSQLSGMETEIETNPFGGIVETFYKESSGPVEVINSEKLSNLINSGVSIISFMGHSISFRLDFNLDNINEYKNKGKYHMFVAMGCYAGEMFLNNRSISESQNLAADKGSIIYLSNTSAGLPQILYKFGNDLYSQLGGKYYNEPVGDAMRAVFKDLIATNGQENIYQALSTSFNGDPAIKLNNNPSVDITPDGTTAKSKENLIFADQKSFEFNIDFVNLGYSAKDSIKVIIENEYPDGSKDTVYRGNVALPENRTFEAFNIPISENRSIGKNKLFLTIDPENEIKEGPTPAAELNNSLVTGMNELGFSYYVIGNNARPIYPEEFAIINEEKPSLIAYNGNTFASKANYYMELDTTSYFNSSLKKSKNFYQTGGVINWKLDENLLPNVVYYWRVRPDSIGNAILAWKTSSFIYIPGKETGWNQSHFFQFKRDDFNGIQINEPSRKFEYLSGNLEFTALNGYIELPTYIRPKVYLKDSVKADYEYWNFRSDLSGIVIAFLDPLTERLVSNKTGSDYGSIGGPNMAGSNYFLFATETKEDRIKIVNFLKNVIPDQNYVVVQTLVQYNYSLHSDEWSFDGPENLIDYLKSIGAKSVDEFLSKGNVPYTIVFGKNRIDYETKDKVGDLLNESQVRNDISVNFKQGSVGSTIIGPSDRYDRFLWQYNGFDASTDNQSIEIYGINPLGGETKLFGPITDLEVDLKAIDAKQYPKLRIVWKTSDPTNRTTPGLNYWRVFYSSLPDIAHDPAFYFYKNYDSLSQGTIFKLELTATNISSINMDSILVKFTLLDQKNTMVESEQRFIPVKAFEHLRIPYQQKTTRQVGAYKLIVELNPRQDQKEFNLSNNIAVIDYYVRKDRRKPKVIVSFDGVIINNGDIVSPVSQIKVLLHDEANSIPMDDPSLFSLKIEAPDKTITVIDPSKQSNVFFQPASGNGNVNEATMIINGDFQQDGTYTLYIKAKDANGNYVSETDEKVDYKIVKESSISNVFNYPNPFSTKTRFVYTLTGDKVPSFYKIQIMTVSGKIVRELDQNEIGPLNIGTHLTEFEYDGTDDLGEKLANGVYLYRALFKDEKGNDITKFETNTDKFFVRNFGKMVILR